MKLIIGFMFEVLVLIFLIWIINMFSIFVHEIGHAIGYIIATKNNNWNVRIGKGKIICKIGRFNIHLTPSTGCFYPIDMKEELSKTKIIDILIGGPLGSFLLLILLILLRNNINSLEPSIITLKTLICLTNYDIIFNIAMFITSVVPYKPRTWLLNGYVSDSYKILKLFKK